jgi:hypothetical protein
MRVASLDDVPFPLLLVATWAVVWGANAVMAAIRALAAGGNVPNYLVAFEAGVLGAVVLVLAVLLFTTTPLVRGLTIVAFLGMAVTKAVSTTLADPVGLGTVALHLVAVAVLLFTKRRYERDRVDLPDEGATRFGVQ